ncbi:N-acetyl-gamma-glutamyl-phosphate reductase [Pseudooceanicola sp. 216_PA32_1]|uniref:N-acetyl-gamma-glutamyl-phosphate reductase n=1 Tax=Pseudooceanicola pacificus TaxID=2676438 RepID=A0A844WCS9_9RHOB|nr:N-acetyl-gamma-glutamyl-phosphate reductase [Pseudooceanicola pacificus]MWB77400.1 N-acetyl-gamma-glutamyl-phosphate reductase [Pseudooceanicola pacificus]
MAWKVFIDGEAGTTGLQIRERLEGRRDVEILSLPPAERKDLGARKAAVLEADVAILCLPDAAAEELVGALPEGQGRVIDASTAFRVAPGWVYGFAEMAPEVRQALSGAVRVSNPGCYPTGGIALLKPMVDTGLIASDAGVHVIGLSGYSGGGKALIAEYEGGTAPAAFQYGTGQRHKHVPELMTYSGLSTRPIFSPTVGNFERGMIVQVPLHLAPGSGLAAAQAALEAAYADSRFVTVLPRPEGEIRVDPCRLNGTNALELQVLGDESSGNAVLVAVLDNLGKGASGAAVQNMNIMLGLDEAEGLV